MRPLVEAINHYWGKVRDNNAKVVDLLRDNFAYIEPQDTEVFLQFVIDHLRMEREFPTTGPLDIPPEIYSKVGEIHGLRKEFVERVKSRFVEMNKVIRSVQ